VARKNVFLDSAVALDVSMRYFQTYVLYAPKFNKQHHDCTYNQQAKQQGKR